MSQNHIILQQAINDGLKPLGDPIVRTILWHLRANGVFLDAPTNIDIRTFYLHLEEIVGNIAGVVLNEIYDNLREKCDSAVPLDPKLPVLVRIERLLSLQIGGADKC